MPTPSHNQPLTPGLRMNGQCPVCGTPYDFQKLRILAERDQNVLTHVECPSCFTAILSLFSVGRTGLTARGLVTDLVAQEVGDLESGEAVNDDEVINLHVYLERGGNIISELEAKESN